MTKTLIYEYISRPDLFLSSSKACVLAKARNRKGAEYKLTESGDFLAVPRKAARLPYHRDPHYSLLTHRSLELLKKFSDVKTGI